MTETKLQNHQLDYKSDVTQTATCSTDSTIGYINLKLYSGGNSAFQFYKIPLCYGSTQRPGKITLTPGSYLTAWTDTGTANNIDCTLCILEQS